MYLLYFRSQFISLVMDTCPLSCSLLCHIISSYKLHFLFLYFSKNYRTSKSGVIMSPKWPRKTTNLLSDECEWDIRVPSNYVIKMNFMDVDLYKTSSYYCRSSNTRLRLKGMFCNMNFL